MNQETGRLLAWFKREGETVTAGEPLMEVETDKSTVEIEAPASGVLANVVAQVGDEVPVGQTIAVILAAGEAAPPARPTTRGAPSATAAATAPTTPAAPATPAAPTPGASPRARRLAAEQSVDLTGVSGSGPGGAVKEVDLPGPPPAPDRPPSRAWAAVVRSTTESWREIPHFYLEREVDAGRLQSWRDAAARAGGDVTITDLLVRLAAAVLSRHSRVNGSWDGERVVESAEAHVGIAVATEQGLLVPVISRAGRLTLAEITAARRQVVERARAGRLRPEDLRDPTFTISNLGMYPIDAFSAIVNRPQAAILAVGRIRDRVVAVAGSPAVRPTLRMTLSCDHRALDGARGAAFLADLGDLIEEPAALL